MIEAYPVVVFAKCTCPYSTQAKSLLKKLEVDYVAHDLDHMFNGGDI